MWPDNRDASRRTPPGSERAAKRMSEHCNALRHAAQARRAPRAGGPGKHQQAGNDVTPRSGCLAGEGNTDPAANAPKGLLGARH